MSESIDSGRRLASLYFGATLAIESIYLVFIVLRSQPFWWEIIFLGLLFLAALLAFSGRAWGKQLFILVACFKIISMSYYLLLNVREIPIQMTETSPLLFSTFYVLFYLLVLSVLAFSKDLKTFLNHQSARRGNLGVSYSPLGFIWVLWTHLNMAFIIQGIFFVLVLFSTKSGGDGHLIQIYFLFPYLLFCFVPTSIIASLRLFYLSRNRPKLLKPIFVNILLLPGLTALFTSGFPFLLEALEGFSSRPALSINPLWLYFGPLITAATITSILRVWAASQQEIRIYWLLESPVTFVLVLLGLGVIYLSAYLVTQHTFGQPQATSKKPGSRKNQGQVLKSHFSARPFDHLAHR